MNIEPFKLIIQNDQDQKEKNTSSEILNVLKNFIEINKSLPKNPREKSFNLRTLLLNKWTSAIACFSLVFLSLVFVIYKIEFTIYTLLLYLSLLIILLIITSAIAELSFFVLKEIKKNRIESFYITASYDLTSYYQTIECLGKNFYEENLKDEEFRFKLALNKIKGKASVLEKTTSLLAILLVVIFIYGFGFPSENNEIKFLYGTIVGVSGIVFVVKILLDTFYKWLEYQSIDVHETCILILQAAQLIAKEEELDATHAYDQAISSGDEVIPFEQAISEIERNR
jgi:hypothetical protein